MKTLMPLDKTERKVIFVGPSLPKGEAHEICPDALILGPMEQGDVDYAHRQLGATIIGMVDGYHSQRLPNWHKECLSALSCGVRLLGAASMGALRAVECEPWGAEPIGEIASWYKEGVIEADDEVCLAHGDESTGWRNFSVPLVNIRATLISAQISMRKAREILEFAESLFYPDRVWPTIFTACETSKEEQQKILSCEIDLKAADAMQLCYALAALPVKPRPARPILNANKGYGKVFAVNDTKVMREDGKAIRLHEIAERSSPNAYAQALNRKLALEFCAMAGIGPRESVTQAPRIYDLEEDDSVRVMNEERRLDRAREWLVSAGSGFHDVPAVLDFLRVMGVYHNVREG